MASLLRQIVAGPRARHPEAGLDLCYVTDHIIATSGPSDTYPQRAYRNPLDSLVKFLDYKHKDNWAIWEFRAEGTGYPDSAVYGRIFHYPFPDHHPPPFQLIPHIMASMRNWQKEKEGRVIVVHCKAGKGRSGTASCSYLVSEEGWELEKALKQFTERRMKPGWGSGVSIPSQLRWLRYVDRWTKHGKIYVERQVEVLEVHCWGLRDGVKIGIEGFVDDGKTIKLFHTFTKGERELIRGEIPSSGGLASVVNEVMGKNGLGRSGSKKVKEPKSSSALAQGSKTTNSKALKSPSTFPVGGVNSSTEDQASPVDEDGNKTGDVIFRPSKRVVLPTSDLNLDVERRNKAAYGLTMVTSVAHVWFNTFFEGNGPEKDGMPDDSGVFEIEWDAMDGIKGSSRKGTRAFDKVAIVWKALPDESGKPGIVIHEPQEGEEVKQTSPADWKGENNVTPSDNKDLGLRTASPVPSTDNVSKASSINEPPTTLVTAADPHENTDEGVRAHGPGGEETIEEPASASSASNTDRSGSNGSGPLPLSNDLPKPNLTHAQLDGTVHGSNNAGSSNAEGGTMGGVPRTTSPESVEQVVKGVEHVSTGDLPDGQPESELKTAKEHSLGHLKKEANVSTSS